MAHNRAKVHQTWLSNVNKTRQVGAKRWNKTVGKMQPTEEKLTGQCTEMAQAKTIDYAQQKTDHADEDECVQFIKSLTMFIYKIYIIYYLFIFQSN